MVAIGPGENDDSKFHAVAAPCSIAGTAILAHTREFGLERGQDKNRDNSAPIYSMIGAGNAGTSLGLHTLGVKSAIFASWLLCVASISSPTSLASRQRPIHGVSSRPSRVC